MVPQLVLSAASAACSLILQTLLGFAAAAMVRAAAQRLSGAARPPIAVDALPALFVAGLLIHLHLIWALKCLGCSWAISVCAPLLLGLPAAGRFIATLKKLRFVMPASLAVWLSVVIVLGVSLFSPMNGISTPWINNYGDLTLHLGMISSMVHGDMFPLQYHLYAGEPLSYPFFINLWTASLWWLSPNYQFLAHIFQYQWLILWTLTYFFLRGYKYPLLPWALLFGGGSYELVVRAVQASPGSVYYLAEAHEFLNSGYPWTPLLPTVWVTQRTALLGLASLLCSLWLFQQWYNDVSSKSFKTPSIPAAALLIASLSSLAHTHFTMTVLAYELCVIGWVYLRRIVDSPEDRVNALRTSAVQAALAAACLLPLGLALPLLSHKSHLISFMPGWLSHTLTYTLPQSLLFLQSPILWGINAGQWLIFAAALLCYPKARSLLAPVLILFVLANVVKLAVWEWDQIKVFVALYAVTLSIASAENCLNIAVKWICPILLLLPGLFELRHTFVEYQSHEVFTAEDLLLAEEVREHTEPDAVILASPDHNSPVVLSGRRLFFGYEGTLHSHGIDYADRKDCLASLADALFCSAHSTKGTQAVRPQYLLWSSREQLLWPDGSPETMPKLKELPQSSLHQIQW